MLAPAGQATARAGQLCWLAALVARRRAPRTPAVVNFRLFVGAAYMRPANLPPHPVSPSPPCRGRACPARDLPTNPFHGSFVGEEFIPPAHLPAAANLHGGQRAGRPTTSLKTPPCTQKRTHNRKGHASFFYASFFMALPSGRLTAVNTAASAKLAARYTGNIPASGKLNRATNRRNTSVSKT